MKPSDIETAILDAIDENDVDLVRSLLTQNPGLIDLGPDELSWLWRVAGRSTVEMAEMLIDLGCDVNFETILAGSAVTALDAAVKERDSNPAMVKCLLEHGADPNFDRLILTAARSSGATALEVVRLLEAHGADLHRVFENEYTGEPMNALSMALDYDRADIADYLRSRGCVLPDSGEQPTQPKSQSDEVIAYFAEHFGPVKPQSLVEIVPTGLPIAVHVVGPAEDRNHVTLFTTGMSAQPMTCPSGDEDFRFAELFIQLPADWRYEEISDPQLGWPIQWLRNLARHPHNRSTWLGGTATIVEMEDPPRPFAPNVPFTSMLLLSERRFTNSQGDTVQLYRLTPLYPEERDLAHRKGLDALMNAFDRSDTPFVVSTTRPPAR